MSRKPTLVIMVKEPRAGRVKTRLGRDIGMTAAAWWYRHQVIRLVRGLRNPRWQLVLAISPDDAVFRAPFGQIGGVVRAQGRGDLGERMRRQLFAARPGPALLIGSDIPGVTAAHIARAFQVLKGQDSVIGPAPDGGFWLVGIGAGARVPKGWMRSVRWSTQHAFADTCASWPGARLALTDTLVDVDTVADMPANNAS